jgi:hypothetical protein
MAAVYAPGSFTTLINKSSNRLKPTRTGAYRKAMGFETLRSLFGVSTALANGYVTTEGLSSHRDNLNRRWIYV